MAEHASRSYQVVARRFRPTRFDEVVGQESIVQLLGTALETGRVPHALLFSGSRGVGKTTLARILARALNCESGPTAQPCDTCRSCTAILAGTNPDVVEIDAASHNLVDDVRELRDRVGLASMGSRYKVYILDEVHMLTRSAFNAFLKTLEEPPPNVVFVMATTELLKVPETIRSRCQVHLFRRVDDGDIARRLRAICDREQVTIPDEVLEDIAVSSRGGMRDAESALERLLPIAEQKGAEFDVETYRRLSHRVGFDAVVEVVAALLTGNAQAGLRFAADAVTCGADEREVLGEVLEVLRALLLMAVDGDDTGLVSHAGQARARLAELARDADVGRLEAMVRAALLGRERIRRLEDRRMVLELALLAVARAGSLAELGELLDAARSGAPAPAPPAAGPVGGQPAPATPSVPPPAAPGGDLRARLLARLGDEQPLLGRTIEHCRVTGPDDNHVVQLELQTDRRLHRDRLGSDGVQKILRTVLRDLLGTDVKVSVALPGAPPADQPAELAPGPPAPAGDPPADPEASAPQPRSPSPSARRRSKPPPGASVQKIVERFDGQILDDDDAASS